jgi:hypothetical protein
MFTFTRSQPYLPLTRTVPFNLEVTLLPGTPRKPGDPRVLLVHCRTGKGIARETEIWEVNLAQNVVVERSGLGGKQRAKLEGEKYDPLRLDPPANGLYRIAFDGTTVRVNDASATVHRKVQPGTTVEIIFGFDDPNPDEDMEAPIGWTLSGVPEADQAVQPPQPPTPPVQPPVPQPPTTPPAPGPVPPTQQPGDDKAEERAARQALISDISAALAKYALARDKDPSLVTLIQMALLFAQRR